MRQATVVALMVAWVVYMVLFLWVTVMGWDVRGPFEFLSDVIEGAL